MSKKLLLILAAMLLVAAAAPAQEPVIAPADNLVVDGVPKIPASLAETAGRYGSYRSASLADWHPTKREMLIATRFAETPQLHLVKMPGGERQQLTFFADSVGGGRFIQTAVTTFFLQRISAAGSGTSCIAMTLPWAT